LEKKTRKEIRVREGNKNIWEKNKPGGEKERLELLLEATPFVLKLNLEINKGNKKAMSYRGK
jgi:hypothetical protein